MEVFTADALFYVGGTGAGGGALGYVLISEVCGGPVPLRPREIQIPESLHTLVIGVCGIFRLIGWGSYAWKNAWPWRHRRSERILGPRLLRLRRGGRLHGWCSEDRCHEGNDTSKSTARSGCATMGRGDCGRSMDIFEEVVRMRQAGERGALATIVHTNGSIPSYESSRMLVRDDGSIVGTVGGGCVEAEVWAAAKEVIVAEQPRKMIFNLNQDAQYDAGLICGGTLEIFVEPILPQPVLYIFGGGHVSTAVAPLAHQAGFKIVIVEDREAFANAERFPMATGIYTSYAEAFEKIQPNSSTYLLIVTRGHSGDMRVLAWAVATEARGFTPRYIGMMGSKRKVIAVYKALEKEGFSAAQFERVHAPVGLDIGALTPEEIAVSIAAELIAVRRNAVGLPNKSIKLSEAAHLLGD